VKDETIQLDLAAATKPRIIFKPGSWLTKMDFINHLILFNNVLITVLSEKEGGKTCFSTLLQSNLDQQIKPISMTLSPPCERTEFIADIATQLHLNSDSSTDLASIVQQVNERKAHVLIIVDNAQNLPEDVIKEAMLAIKSQDSFGYFHLCLVSDYSVVATLNKLAVEQFDNLIHTIELGLLNESETRTYVLQRAMNARLINRPLSDAQFKQFYQMTKGNLAKINANLESFILKGSTPQKTTNSVNVKRVGAIAGSAFLVVAAAYTYFNNAYQTTSITDLVSASTKSRMVKIFTNKPTTADKPKQLVSKIPNWEDFATRQFVAFALPKKQVLDDNFFEEENYNTVAIVDKVLVVPKVVAKIPAEKAVALAKEVTSKSTKVAKPAIKSNPKLAQKKPDSVHASEPATKEGAVKFTIQLTASHKESDIHRFRKNNKIVAKTKIRHFTNAKGSWYILTFGEYSTMQNAREQAKKLPPQLTKLNPWIRTVTGLENIG